MRFTSNVWVYRDVLIRPGDPFEAPEKLSDAWIEIDGPKKSEIVIPQDDEREELDKPRRGRPPKVV